MHYKTMALELLQALYPTLHGRLKASRTLLATLDDLASTLRERHRAWTDELRLANPGLDPARVSAEALELAIEDLTDRLPSESAGDAAVGAFSLDAAMSYLRRATPPA